MDARIQYTKTSDGATIAYWVMGDEGPTIVMPPPAHPWSHIEMELQIPEWRLWYELLAERYRIVRFDYRGSGLSERRLPTGLDDFVLDQEAVLERIGANENLVLFGCYYAGLVAMAYAAKHPEKVSHLILWCGFARVEDTRKTEFSKAFDALLDASYEMFTNTLANTVIGWDEGLPAHNMARYMQESIDHESIKTIWPQGATVDVTPLLPQIKAKTLQLQRKDFKFVTAAMARDLASQLPNSHVSFINGDSVAPYLDDVETPMRLIHEFLADHPDHKREDEEDEPIGGQPAGAFRTIVFTDIESSTAITQHLGDEKAQELLRRHNQIVRQALRDFGGEEIKHTGDGIMASFPAASRAIECALAIQRAFEEYNASLPARPEPVEGRGAAHGSTGSPRAATAAEPIRVRIGLNAGEPVAEDEDLFGTAVQLAARVCARAEAGEVLASNVVRELAAGKGFLFSDRGDVELRGFEDPVRLYEVRPGD